MRGMQLVSFRRQQLLVEYASLKHIKLRGIYVSLTPDDPSEWSGVLFVRTGAYAPAIFRFRIHFPHDYPYVPPVITFNVDIFHPLIAPLTTYTYVGPPQSDGTETKQLPPGALSLRHGFPIWYREVTRDLGPEHRASPEEFEDLTVAEILRYVRNCFEAAEVLDSVPLEAAANPSAWYAWQSHRGHPVRATDKAMPGAVDNASPRGKGPGDWNWEGVWDERIKRAVHSSLSEGALYGSVGPKEVDIRFAKLDEEELNEVRRLLQVTEDTTMT